MTENKADRNSYPIDAVIAWVDGSDPVLKEKRLSYAGGGNPGNAASGAHSTRFASVNEIRYCVLSIMKFAPFVRNIFIVTDRQDPDLYGDIKKLFPERLSSFRIVDHKEIFEGFEDCLPTFNSISIGQMIWRIKGLSENFVYFNDDIFLIRDMRPEDWFINGKPVMRGKWVPAPHLRVAWNRSRIGFNRHVLGKKDYKPRASFHLGQWNSASLLGFKWRYFTGAHTPHSVEKKTIEEFYASRTPLLRQNLAFRFRNPSQFTFIALSNHLQLKQGNRQIATPGLAYLQPHKRAEGYIDKKIRICENDPGIKFLCVQSLDLCSKEDQEKVLGWLEGLLSISSVSLLRI